MILNIDGYDTGFTIQQPTYFFNVPQRKAQTKIYDEYAQLNYQLSNGYRDSEIWHIKAMAEFTDLTTAENSLNKFHYYANIKPGVKNFFELEIASGLFLPIYGVIEGGIKVKQNLKGGNIVFQISFKVTSHDLY